jgi:hypothetical protein
MRLSEFHESRITSHRSQGEAHMSESQGKKLRAAQGQLLTLANAVCEYFGDDDIDPLLTGDIELRNMARAIVSDSTGHESPVTSLTPERVTDPRRFFCPYCGAFRPGYGVNYQRHPIPGVGVVGYLVLFCAMEDCRKILTNAVVEFLPDPSAAAALAGEGKRIIS